MRQTRLKRPIWIWGLVAAFLILIVLNASLILTFRFVEFQPEIFKNLSILNELPDWQAWSIIMGIAMVAGICEEIGFRGYMQKPLEQKYGPVVGTFERKPVNMTGVDNHFIIAAIVLLFSMVLFVVAIRELLKLKREMI